MKKILYLLTASLIFMVSCKKAEFEGNEPTGEGLVDFTIIGPATGSAVVLNAATPDAPVNFSWNAARPGLITSPTYKIVMALRATGDLNTPLIEFPITGSVTAVALTHKQLDDALKAKSIADGALSELKWTIKATNGDVSILSTSTFFINITRMKDGATPFVLLAPVSSSAPVTIDPGSTSSTLKFNWTRSKPATGGPGISYRVLFSLTGDFNAPLFSIASNAAPGDSVLTMTYKAFSDSLSAHGQSNLSQPSNLKWTVVATSGTWKQQADYVNELVIIREVKVYIVGSATPGGWDIAQSTRLIEDPRFPGTYFTYIQLSGGNEIKFVNGQAWPPAPGAVDWGQDPALAAGNLTDVGENNIPVTTSGVYRVTVDLSNKKFYLQTAVANGIGGMGMIGNFQGWSHPAVKIPYIGVNKFIYLVNMNTNDEFKFHDGNDWNNSANNLHRWYAVDGANKMVIDPGSGYNNFKWTGANGRVRAIWDGSNTQDLKYDLNAASEMRVVGDGMQGITAWDPPTSPQMTYSGNGIWTITLNLVANKEIKFLAGNAWGAFDYEDNSGGVQTTGTPRPIKWDGGPNFKTPATSGSYTITLNEYTQTVTIN
ncbi:MAG TPA: SusF/SusE family outer membrane protein [Chitinophagaceae bacterium]|nr:SusF/SusE family outer membrane protein [Chitinophagaceae bacterium]HRG92279.1 SusF/SusE family outer membrane protein [Chitinophagaceae bacterium]